MATIALADVAATPAAAKGPRRQNRRREVVVLGAGVAGLTAAHELAERGFKVTVVERNGIAGFGGKARSIPVPGSGRHGRQDLPGEHGFRIFFGFYQALTETMRRIPFEGNSRGVFDNLRDTSQGWIMRDAGRPPFVFPYGAPTVRGLNPAVLDRILRGLLAGAGVPPHETADFVRHLLAFITSSHERRVGELEYTPWATYVEVEKHSRDYERVWGRSFVDNAQAIRTRDASTRSTGLWVEQLLFNILGIHRYDGTPIRVLDGPTTETFITPWVRHLRTLGVRFMQAHATALEMDGGRSDRGGQSG